VFGVLALRSFDSCCELFRRPHIHRVVTEPPCP